MEKPARTPRGLARERFARGLAWSVSMVWHTALVLLVLSQFVGGHHHDGD